MNDKILIVEDFQDVYENIERKITTRFNNVEVLIADNCDDGFNLIKKHINSSLKVVIVDLTFKYQKPYAVLKNGRELLEAIKKEGITIPTIVYSSHDDLYHIHPILKNYSPNAYVIKSNTSSQELLFALEEVLAGKRYFSQRVHLLQFNRLQFSIDTDEIDEQIIKLLPEINSMKGWEGKVLKDNIPMSYKSIKSRIDVLCQKFEVDNEKQLVLKLYKLAII